MAVEEEEGEIGIPEWVVTFGDMMSLLLTFFIMLVSLSEIKEEEKYQALVQSVKAQFGYSASRVSIIPGSLKPRNSALANLATMGRARRHDIMKGGDKVQAPVGDYPRVMIVRPGTKTAVGTVIYFAEDSVQLGDEQRAILRQHVTVIEGKPQKIEIRGHTSPRPVSEDSNLRDNWDLSYERCRQTKQYLVDVMKIDPRRIRMSVAGPNEPVHIGTDAEQLKLNPRVEVYLLDEVVRDSVGTPEERQKRFVQEN
jgi:chemotaxis protein MotB